MNLQTNVKYLDGLQFKLDWYRDKNGNTRTLPFTNEKYTINPVTHTVQLKRIPAENSSIKIEQSLSRMSGVITPITFEEVDVISQPNHFIFNREDNVIQFHTSINGDILVDYQAIGQFVLDADSIATAYDSKGNVLEYLSDLIKSANNALANVTVVGDLSDAIEQIKAYIGSSIQLSRELNVNVNLAKIENANLKSQVPLGQITNTQLREALLESQDSINKLTQVGGKTITVTTEMWGARQSDGFYKYRYTHNLGTMAIDISGHMLADEVLWVAHGKKIDNNTIELWNETNDGVVVSVFARAYGGTVVTLDGFNTSHLVESPDKKYFTKQNENDLNNNISQVKSLSSQVSQISVSKSDKTYVDNKVWTMANMGQDVKTAMTGGSVAVVGTNAVNTVNLVNNAVIGDKVANDTLTIKKVDPTVTESLKVEFTSGNNNSIRATFNTDKSVTLVLTALDIQMLKKNRTRHTSIYFGSAGDTFIIPNNGRLVWRWRNADGTFGHTVEVLQKDQACIEDENFVLVQNCNGNLYGLLSQFIKKPSSIDGNIHIAESTIDNKALNNSINCIARVTKPIKTKALTGADSGKVEVTIEANTTMNFYTQNGTYFKGKGFTTDTVYVIPGFGGLYYNFVTGEIIIAPNGTSIDGTKCVCLLNNSSPSMLSGLLEHACLGRFWGDTLRDNSITTLKIADGHITLNKLSNDLKDKINSIGSTTGNNNTLPNYWIDHLNTKIPTIQTLQENDVKGFSFAFLTDTHIDVNEVLNGTRTQPLFSGEILKKLDNDINFSSVVCGGDMVSLQNDENGCKSVLRETISRYLAPFRDKVIATIGNHDYAYDYRPTPTKCLSKSLLYSIVYKPFMKNMVMGDLPFTSELGSGNLYCYKDDIVNKVRYISLCCYDTKVVPNYFEYDVAFLGEQLRWLSEKALNVKDKTDGAEWKFVIVTHQPIVTELAFGNSIPHNSDSLKKILENFVSKTRCTIATTGGGGIRPVNLDVDFSSYKGKLLCVLNGHMHLDLSATINGVNYIEAEGDVMEGTENKNTYNEHSITVFTVCPTENKLKVTRVGRINNSRPLTTEYTY